MASQYFRAAVGLLVTDGRGRLLAVERHAQPGQWQLPQGGLKEREEPADGAAREMAEELGLLPAHVHLLGEHPRWLAYELPEAFRSRKTGRGQVVRWFAFRLVVGDEAVRLDHGQRTRELRAWEWLPAAEVVRRVAGFRRDLYAQVVEDMQPLWTQP